MGRSPLADVRERRAAAARPRDRRGRAARLALRAQRLRRGLDPALRLLHARHLPDLPLVVRPRGRRRAGVPARRADAGDPVARGPHAARRGYHRIAPGRPAAAAASSRSAAGRLAGARVLLGSSSPSRSCSRSGCSSTGRRRALGGEVEWDLIAAAAGNSLLAAALAAGAGGARGAARRAARRAPPRPRRARVRARSLRGPRAAGHRRRARARLPRDARPAGALPDARDARARVRRPVPAAGARRHACGAAADRPARGGGRALARAHAAWACCARSPRRSRAPA